MSGLDPTLSALVEGDAPSALCNPQGLQDLVGFTSTIANDEVPRASRFPPVGRLQAQVRRRDQANQKKISGSVCDPAEQVATDLVGAEPVLEAGGRSRMTGLIANGSYGAIKVAPAAHTMSRARIAPPAAVERFSRNLLTRRDHREAPRGASASFGIWLTSQSPRADRAKRKARRPRD
jgi:hypothetical protein